MIFALRIFLPYNLKLLFRVVNDRMCLVLRRPIHLKGNQYFSIEIDRLFLL